MKSFLLLVCAGLALILAVLHAVEANSGVLVYGFSNNCTASNLYTFVSAPITKKCAQAGLPNTCSAKSETYTQYACSDAASPLVPKQTVLPDDFLMISIFQDSKCAVDTQYRVGYILNSCKWYTNRYMNFKKASDGKVAYISCSDSKCSKCSSAGYVAISNTAQGACAKNAQTITGNSAYSYMGAIIYSSTAKSAKASVAVNVTKTESTTKANSTIASNSSSTLGSTDSVGSPNSQAGSTVSPTPVGPYNSAGKLPLSLVFLVSVVGFALISII